MTQTQVTTTTRGHVAPLVPSTLEITFEVRRKPYISALPLMWLLLLWVRIKKMLLGRKPTTNTFWFDGLSSTCRGIKEGAASWRALNLIYNHPFGVHGIVTDFWLGMRNAQAVRNRKKLVTSLLVHHLSSLVEEGKVRILSLASGSAQSIVEALAILKKQGIMAEAVLVDIDPNALNHSRELAEKYGVQEQVTLVKLDIRDLLRLERSLSSYGKFHVVEVVGWLEYDKDKRIRSLLHSVRSLLVQDGILVTSTINDNPERWFLHWVIDWEMIYRSKEVLAELLLSAEFPGERYEIVTEPQGIFHVAVCRN